MNDPEKMATDQTSKAESSLSYKFQRLREKLREAIASGELTGKLPGERALAKRFHVNAKTLSKALTDLAAEGLLDRSIGRGTFVKGSSPITVASKRWLLLCDAQQTGWELVRLLSQAHEDLEIITDITSVRPSFLNQFSAVIDLAENTPESFIRDLVVRNIGVVVVGKEPKTYSTHSVCFDGRLAVMQCGRDLLLSGHRKIAAVEPQSRSLVAHTLRQAAARYAPDAVIDACFPNDIASMIDNGITAFVCHSLEWARQVREQLNGLSIDVPGKVSVLAVGSTDADEDVSGYFMHRPDKANAIVQLLTDTASSRPATLWLAGKFVDRQTMGPVPAIHHDSMEIAFHRTAV